MQVRIDSADANDLQLYSRAIGAARKELAFISAQYEILAKRKAQLEAFIANGEPLIPEGPKPTLFPSTVSESKFSQETTKRMPTWKAIVLSINGKRNDFTVSDAIESMDRIGRPVLSKNKFQIVRAELQRKDDVFKKLGPGHYAVLEKGEPEIHQEATEVAS